MMRNAIRNIYYILIVAVTLFVSFGTALANDTDFEKIINIKPFEQQEYPEEINKFINVYTGVSPMVKTSHQKQFTEAWVHNNGRSIKDLVSEVGFNNFTLGTGRVDVTMQVRRGVKYAIRDVLNGYPEYQRRKQVEEILNANYVSNKLTSRFLLGLFDLDKAANNKRSFGSNENSIFAPITEVILGFDSSINSIPKLDDLSYTPGIMGLLNKTLHNQYVKDLEKVFASIAKVILIILILFFILKIISIGEPGVLPPVLLGILVWILVSFSDNIVDYLFSLVKFIFVAILNSSKDYLDLYLYEDLFYEIDRSWQFVANKIGYFPAFILSVINLLLQFFMYFYVAGLFLHIILGKVFAPIWFMAMYPSFTRGAALNSIIIWFKSLLTIALIPFVYVSIYFIANKFQAIDYAYMNIVLSLAGIVFLPFLSRVLFSGASGIFHSAFQGYGLVIETISSSVDSIKNIFESSSLTGSARMVANKDV